MAFYYGFNPPFVGGRENVLSRQEDEQLIRNDILQLLLTSPGERVMRPTFGAGLRKVVFEQNDDFVEQTVRNSILEALNNYEPRVTTTTLTVSRIPDEYKVEIYYVGQLINDPQRRITIERILDFEYLE